MLEIWSKEQIEEQLPDADFWDLWKEISSSCEGMAYKDAEGKVFGKWTLERIHVMPAESVSLILQLNSGSLLLKAEAVISDITRQQVFRRKRMVPVIDYVDLKTYDADPGVSTLFGA